MRKIFVAACLLLTALQLGAQTATVATLAYKSDKQEKITYVSFTHNSRYVIFGTEAGTVVRSTLPQALDANLLAKHDKPVCAIVSTVDGGMVISASIDQTVRIWEASNNSVSTIKTAATNNNNEYNTLLAVSPDGRYLATTNLQGARVWDLGNKAILAQINYVGTIKDLRFSPDSKQLLLCGGTREAISIFESSTGKALGALKLETGNAVVTAFDISFDGKYVVTASENDKTLRVWLTANRQVAKQALFEKDPIKLVRYSNDGQYIFTGSDDNKVKTWRASDLSLKLSVFEYGDDLRQLALSNDGQFYMACDGTEKVQVMQVSWLGIKPWKPADIQAPTIVMITPRMSKERGVQNRAYSNQQRVRVQCKVNDFSGVAQVLINGKPAQRSFSGNDKYESEEVYTFQENVENKVVVTAIDSLGNQSEVAVAVEFQRITGIADANYYALFIAVQDYTNPEVTPLDNPIADAKRLMAALTDNFTFKPENIMLLENPNRAQIQEKLDELQASLTKNDNLLIFYAGHGVWDEDMQQGFWLPVDAGLSNRTNWFPNNQLKDYISSIKAKHTLLVADACFSGALFKTRAVASDVSPAIQELYNLASRKAMTSGALKTVSDKSVFLDYFIRTLEGNMEDYVNAMDMFNSFRNDVINNTPNRQVPLYGEIAQTGDQGGDFVFVSKRRK